MRADLTYRPARPTPRAPARFITGLALVAVIAACGSGSGSDDAVGAGAPPTTTPATTASADVPIGSSEPTSTKTASPDRTRANRRSKASNNSDGLDGPYTLRIPRIGVDAPVVPIQSDAQRVLNPPRDPSVAGWWSDGAAPGASRGSAVLVGHTVRRGGGVFDDMKDLSRGDAIQVKGSDSALTYRVKSVDVLGKDEVARQAEQIFAQSGAGRLVIITCDDWDGSAWQSNIVTVAAPA